MALHQFGYRVSLSPPPSSSLFKGNIKVERERGKVLHQADNFMFPDTQTRNARGEQNVALEKSRTIFWQNRSVISKAVDYKVYQMWPPFLSLKILGLGRQVNWLYRPACVGRLCHSKYKMAATSDILYKSTALI